MTDDNKVLEELRRYRHELNQIQIQSEQDRALIILLIFMALGILVILAAIGAYIK